MSDAWMSYAWLFCTSVFFCIAASLARQAIAAYRERTIVMKVNWK